MNLQSLMKLIEFLLAIGSILGLLGLIVGLFWLILMGSRHRDNALFFIFICLLLLIVCGWNTGLRYFRINI
ncbi:MAG: hypothetical protein ACTSWE_16740 [Promethearchaeota archaeon]